MKMKLFPLVILFLLNSNCKSQYNLSKISETVYEVQKLKFEDNIYILKALNKYRKDIKWHEKLEYSCERDTISILEHAGVQGDFQFTFWSKEDTVSYTNESGTFKMTKEPLFTNYMMQLISQWDTLQIKKEEKINSNFIPNEIIYATRIILSNGKYTISSISFQDFYTPERDVYNQYD